MSKQKPQKLDQFYYMICADIHICLFFFANINIFFCFVTIGVFIANNSTFVTGFYFVVIVFIVSAIIVNTCKLLLL